MPGVQVCIVSRDGRIDDEVLGRAHAAVLVALRGGMQTELALTKDVYNVATCRNRGVAGFLAKDFDHVLFVDDDVKIPPNAVVDLAAAATKHGPGVFSGCIPSVRIEQSGRTTPYVQVKPTGAREWLSAWPTTEIDAEAVGGGCMMISRPVFEAVGYPWFRWPEFYTEGIGVQAITDDANFCQRAIAAGYRVTALPFKCGHKKTIDVALLVPD